MIKTDEHTPAEFAAFIGIDWADRKHAWALQVENERCVEHGELDHTPQAVDLWAAELARRFGGRPIAVALEQSRGSLLFMLTKYAHLVLFPIHPATSVNYRKGFRPSGAKSDPSDAGLLLDLLVRHREKLRRLDPDTEQTRTLQFLVEARRKFVNDKTSSLFSRELFPAEMIAAAGGPIGSVCRIGRGEYCGCSAWDGLSLHLDGRQTPAVAVPDRGRGDCDELARIAVERVADGG